MTGFDEALRLWRGEPLLDAGDAEYALGYRNSWRALRSRTEEDRLAALLGAGLYDDVVADAEALAAAHPLNERVGGCAAAGPGRCTAGSRRRWWRTRACGPGCATTSAPTRDPSCSPCICDCSGASPEELPAAPTSAAPTTRRTNLRTALTSFVGREDDLDRVLTAVRTQRLTTLIGAGGSGKTRLAIEAGCRWLDLHPDSSPGWSSWRRSRTGDELVAAVLGALGGARHPADRAHRAAPRRTPGSGCSTGSATRAVCW